uniref:Uncharacterized protein n=1 Tax=Cacopsylla melanoneura TaxID=428564 RepID=A0A8D8TS06_9HEMI
MRRVNTKRLTSSVTTNSSAKITRSNSSTLQDGGSEPRPLSFNTDLVSIYCDNRPRKINTNYVWRLPLVLYPFLFIRSNGTFQSYLGVHCCYWLCGQVGQVGLFFFISV